MSDKNIHNDEEPEEFKYRNHYLSDTNEENIAPIEYRNDTPKHTKKQYASSGSPVFIFHEIFGVLNRL